MIQKVQSVDEVLLSARVCDLCNDSVTDEGRKVVKSFVLTDWGAICINCWADKVSHPEEFKVVRAYAKGTVVEDEWVERPLVFFTLSPTGLFGSV